MIETVYIVSIHYHYDDTEIRDVFSDKKDAEQFAEELVQSFGDAFTYDKKYNVWRLSDTTVFIEEFKVK